MELKISNLKVDAGKSSGKGGGRRGEGSRGGVIIGHTSTGKPIYDTHRNKAHNRFSGKEHLEAAKHHLAILRETPRVLGQYREIYKSERAMTHHLKQAAKKTGKPHDYVEFVEGTDDAELKKLNRTSLGEQVAQLIQKNVTIGKTSTGKPVYNYHYHPSHKKFTPEEHKEAVALHKAKAREAAEKIKSNPRALNISEEGAIKFHAAGIRGHSAHAAKKLKKLEKRQSE